VARRRRWAYSIQREPIPDALAYDTQQEFARTRPRLAHRPVIVRVADRARLTACRIRPLGTPRLGPEQANDIMSKGRRWAVRPCALDGCMSEKAPLLELLEARHELRPPCHQRPHFRRLCTRRLNERMASCRRGACHVMSRGHAAPARELTGALAVCSLDRSSRTSSCLRARFAVISSKRVSIACRGVPTSVRGLATSDTLRPAGICRRPGPHLRWDWHTSAPGPVISHRCYTNTANMIDCAGLNWGALREVGEPASPSPSQPWPAAATPSIRVPFR
jgi:hypothetical protein